MLAVVRVRGSVKADRKINDTLKLLRLPSINNCVVVPETPQYLGMLKAAKDYITWGKIDEKTMKKLLKERGNPKEATKYTFRLNPPKHGFRNIRLPYPKGSLGNRKERINELLERMI